MTPADAIWAVGGMRRTDRMSVERLSEIRERDRTAVPRMFHARMTRQERDHLNSDLDRRELLAEVDRLTRELAEAQGKVARAWDEGCAEGVEIGESGYVAGTWQRLHRPTNPYRAALSGGAS